MNIHFILKQDGTGNFNEVSDQAPYTRWNEYPPYVSVAIRHPADTAQNGYAYARGIVADMNTLCAANPAQWSPYNTVATLAKKMRVVLNGVYFHRVSNPEFIVNNQTYQGIFLPTGGADHSMFSRYAVAKDSVINMFFLPTYANSVSPNNIGGMADTIGFNRTRPLNNWVKMFNVYELYKWRREWAGNTTIYPGYTIPDNARMMTANSYCHELSHLFGLYHPFNGGNGCADLNTGSDRCTGGNLMGYCDGSGNALSPCQLETAHRMLRNPNAPGTNDYQRYYSRTVTSCDDVPPRAMFRLSTCNGSAQTVTLDGRGTFNAQRFVINIYNATPGRGNGTLLGSRSTTAQPNGRWNLARMFTFTATGQYFVELVAYSASGARHSARQYMTLATLPEACIAVITPTP